MIELTIDCHLDWLGDILAHPVTDLSSSLAISLAFLLLYSPPSIMPFSLVVGKVENHAFIVDTHKIPELVGGNGNAHLRIYGAGNAHTSRAICVWLWRRLKACNAKTGSGQSLALVLPLIDTEISSSKMDDNFQDSLTEQSIHIPMKLENVRRKVNICLF